jgi:hypothetical protein
MVDVKLRDSVASAIKDLKAENPALEFGTVHERTTAHRLAVHLEMHFKTWNVDCEYNRDERFLQKMLMGIAQCRAGKTTDGILPDIIVHHRGHKGHDNNLLVIELKRNAARDACDHEKLRLLTNPSGHYQYQVGLYINIDDGHFHCSWYQNGKLLA